MNTQPFLSLTKYSYTDVKNLTFFDTRIQGTIVFKHFWQATHFYSLPNLLDKALLVKNEFWYQLFYDHNQKEGLQAAMILLNLLPSSENDVKFASLHKELWEFVNGKWPNLHFNNHLIYKFQKQDISINTNIKSLIVRDLDCILQHQKYTEEYGGEPYVKHCIETGMTLGYKIHEKLVAWVILHDDMSMGFLRVLPRYRKHLFATQLTTHFVNKIITRYQNAIAYINIYNTTSRKIADNINAEVIGEVSWVRLRTPAEIVNYKKGIF